MNPTSTVFDHDQSLEDGFAERWAAGRETAQDLERQRLAYRAWLNAGGAVCLERCVHLPSTSGAIRRTARNYWIGRAAGLVPNAGRWTRFVELQRMLEKFQSRGHWREWQGFEDPPAGACDVDTAMFHVMRLNGGSCRGLGAMNLKAITRHLFD